MGVVTGKIVGVLNDYGQFTLTNEMQEFLGITKGNVITTYFDENYIYIEKKKSIERFSELLSMGYSPVEVVINTNSYLYISKKFVRALGLYYGQLLSIDYDKENRIMKLKPFERTCMICKTSIDIMVYGGISLCKDCHSKFV